MSTSWKTNGELEHDLEIAAREGVAYLVKAFRGAVRMDQAENRALLSAATATLGNYTRNRATTSAMAQTELVRARLLAEGGDTARLLLEAKDED